LPFCTCLFTCILRATKSDDGTARWFGWSPLKSRRFPGTPAPRPVTPLRDSPPSDHQCHRSGQRGSVESGQDRGVTNGHLLLHPRGQVVRQLRQSGNLKLTCKWAGKPKKKKFRIPSQKTICLVSRSLPKMRGRSDWLVVPPTIQSKRESKEEACRMSEARMISM